MKYLLRFKADGKINGEVVYKAGQVYEISDETGSATRWIKRGAEIVERGYDPLADKPDVVDTGAGEVVNQDPAPVEDGPKDQAEPEVEDSEPSGDAPDQSEEVAGDDALAALGGEEEVVNEEPNKENKKGKKPSKAK